MAIVAPGRPHADQQQSEGPGSSAALARLLADAARLDPGRPAFRDGPGRQSWCGRPSFELNCEIGAEAVGRLAAYLAGLGLERYARVGVCLPNGSEAALSILAVGEAGLTPCLLDVTANAGELSNAIETADIRAVITQARLGADRPAQKLCFVAAGFFRLRFLMAFGPDVPDGVVDLDPVLLAPRRSTAVPLASSDMDHLGPGLVSFARGSGGRGGQFRTYRSLIAAAAPIVRAAKLRPGERLLTFLPPDDLKGLATGLVAGLIAGATVEGHAVFDSALLLDALAGSDPTHLAVPGWMEPVLAEADLGSDLRSVIFVHEPPLRFENRPGMRFPVVDVVCCAELALLSSRRHVSDRLTFADLGDGGADPLEPSLLQWRLSDGDELWLRGPAVAAPDHGPADALDWRNSGLFIERDGAEITGIA